MYTQESNILSLAPDIYNTNDTISKDIIFSFGLNSF